MKKLNIEVSFEKYHTKIPYYEFNGEKDGPVLFITGGIHGDEINGIHLVRKVLNWLKQNNIESNLIGKIYLFPILNKSAFKHMQRKTYEDNFDLNRSFGFKNINTFSKKIAKVLEEEVFSKCDYGIDCHDSGGRSVLLPHTRVHKCEPLNCSTMTKEMGQLFGTKVIVERRGDENMLSVHLKNKYDISVITCETGGAQTIFEEYVDIGFQGIKNILVGLKMISGEMKLPNKQFILHDRHGVKLKHPAEVNFQVNLGEFVKEDDLICEVYYPQLQRYEEIKAHTDGVIFSRWQFNQIPIDTRLYSILEVDEDDNVLEDKENFDELKSIDIEKIIL